MSYNARFQAVLFDDAEVVQPMFPATALKKDKDDLFSKLDNLEVTDELSSITMEDKAACVDLQQHYDTAINYLNRMMGTSEDDNSFISITNWNYELTKKMKDVKERFVIRIGNHFEKTYSINLELHNKFLDENYIGFHYKEVILEIEEQLGGLNFQERFEEEIKNKCKEDVGSYLEVTLKSKVLSIKNLFYFDHFFSPKISFSGKSREKLVNIINALELFDKKDFNLKSQYPDLYSYGYVDSDALTKYELDGARVCFIKFFKNGSFNIGFDSYESGHQFCKEYLLRDMTKEKSK